MKRPFLVIGSVALIVSFIAIVRNLILLLVIFTIFLIGTTVLLIISSKKKCCTLSSFIVLGIILIILIVSIFLVIHINKAERRISGSTAAMTVTVIREPTNYGIYTEYFCKGKHPQLDYNILFAVRTDKCSLSMGDSADLVLRFFSIEPEYSKRSLADGSFVYANVITVNEEICGNNIYKSIGNLRKSIKNNIYSVRSDDLGGILIALLTGDRTYISDFLYNDTKVCGVTHILVVSGMHIGILTGAVFWLFKKLHFSKKLGILSVFFLICAVLVICDFHSSALRAAVTGMLLLLSTLIGRKADPLNSLGFAVSVMTLCNPLIAGNVAFLLSVFSTFGIIFVAPRIIYLTETVKSSSPLAKPINYALRVIIASCSAIIVIIPVTVYYFEYVSILSPLVTVFISIAVEAALILTSTAALLTAVPLISALSVPIIIVSSLIADYISAVITLFANLEFTVLHIQSRYANLCFVFVAILIGIITLLYNKKIYERRTFDAERKNP